MKQAENILIIRLGALGDFIQSFYCFSAIRHHHAHARITLLTTRAFADLARQSPWFDFIEIDEKPSWFNIPAILRLRKKIQGFDYIYDLQTSSRSTRYLNLVGQRNGSGIAVGLSHVHDNPERNFMHTVDRQRDQLQKAGIHHFPSLDLDWFSASLDSIIPVSPYIVLVPGCSIKRPEKRWSVENYAEIARLAVQQGRLPVIVGGKDEVDLAKRILQICPEGINLVGKTNLLQLSNLMKHAEFSLGNDTGPMHIAAMIGCSSYVLFSAASNPVLTAPRGRKVRIITQKDLRNLSVNRVVQELDWAC